MNLGTKKYPSGVVIIMGVSGTGKSTVGKLLADKLKIPFFDADDFHPRENIEKMQHGEPLTDEDRKPWLEHLAKEIEKWRSQDGAVLACSALKQKYRILLQGRDQAPITWVHLTGDAKTIFDRMQGRKDHFMPESLLQSQLDTLEPPANAIEVEINQSPEKMVVQIMHHL